MKRHGTQEEKGKDRRNFLRAGGVGVLAVAMAGVKGFEGEAAVSPGAGPPRRKEPDHPLENSGPMKADEYQLKPVGFVRSPIRSLQDAPKQGHEGAPNAWLEIDPALADAMEGLQVGQEIFVLTWLHMARRDILKVHPRRSPANSLRGVFAMRSPHRPNPVGLHRVKILEIDRPVRLKVSALEALTGTPIIDIKPVIMGDPEG
jgi:tRNA-Thr(GGU) m(6)t(6)A37 methyltransferase TsaA